MLETNKDFTSIDSTERLLQHKPSGGNTAHVDFKQTGVVTVKVGNLHLEIKSYPSTVPLIMQCIKEGSFM